MKKLAILVLFLAIFSANFTFAQEVTLTAQTKAELVAEIREKINLLMQELIAELMKELAAQTAQLNTQTQQIAGVNTKLDEVNNKLGSISTSTTITTPPPVVTTNYDFTIPSTACVKAGEEYTIIPSNITGKFRDVVFRIKGSSDDGSSNEGGGIVFPRGDLSSYSGNYFKVKPGSYDLTMNYYNGEYSSEYYYHRPAENSVTKHLKVTVCQ